VSSDKLVKDTGRKAVRYRGAECLNCGHPLDLSDVYCSYCGQLNTTKKLAIKDFFKEFIGSVLTYDSRLRYTIKDLLFKPGTISKNYAKGQRFKYANPFRFFLSVSIMYFIVQGVISFFSGGKNSMISFDNSPDLLVIDSVSKANNNFVGFTKNEIGNDLVFNDKEFVIDRDTISFNIDKKTASDIEYISEKDLDTLQWVQSAFKRAVLYRDFYTVHKIKNSTIALDSLKHNNTKLNRWIYEKNDAIDRIINDKYGFLNYLLGKVPFFLFFFAPFFAFFFWLIYSKKKYTYMEHMVFIFHIFSFLFLALLICTIPDTLLDGPVFSGIIFGIIGPFYFYKALRNFYMQGRLITILKFVFLNFVFFVSATFAALVFFAITAATY